MSLKIDLPNGKYVVAVSGGVDSMVLLDLMSAQAENYEIIVAHYVHNVRNQDETADDLKVIEEYCDEHGLKLVIGNYPGTDQSEAALREARYIFLNSILKEYKYQAVVTAHHKDDLLETAIINLLRGTAGAGLHSITNSGQLLRPLLDYSKSDILTYAKDANVGWHNDVTNSDERYLRNYVRGNIIDKLQKRGHVEKLLEHVEKQKSLNEELGHELAELNRPLVSRQKGGVSVDRANFILMPHSVAKLFLKSMIERLGVEVEIDRKTIEKAVVFAKTARSGASLDLSSKAVLTINDEQLQILERD